MDRGVTAAVRRFPDWGLEIRRLALADSSFRSLCDDFGDAEDALQRWSQAPVGVEGVKTAEYAILVEELAGEIAGIVLSRLEAHARPASAR